MLNSKTEYSRCRLPRLTIDCDEWKKAKKLEKSRSPDKDSRGYVIKLSNRFANLEEEGGPIEKDEKPSSSIFMIGKRSLFQLVETRKSCEIKVFFYSLMKTIFLKNNLIYRPLLSQAARLLSS